MTVKKKKEKRKRKKRTFATFWLTDLERTTKHQQLK